MDQSCEPEGAYLKKEVVKMVGEVMELGRGHGCRQEGGRSTGTPGCSRSLRRSFGRGIGFGRVLLQQEEMR